MPIMRLCLLAVTIALTLPGAALAHTPSPSDGFLRGGTNVPLAMSPNVTLHSSFPETTAISGEFAHTGEYFYASSADSISVFDTTDQRRPKLVGYLGNIVFENEAMSYGERVVDGELQRFVLVGNDLWDVAVDPHTGPARGRLGGGEVIVVDVTDPRDPHVRSRTPGSGAGAVNTSTHTVQCLTVSCQYVYTAGEAGEFSIVDMGDLDNPRQVKTAPSTASAPNPVFTSGAGHYWDFDAKGIGWHTGSGGAAAFDVSDPLNPKRLNGTDENGTRTPWNDFIHHNSMRPNATRFSANRSPRLSGGNVLLVTEEDYANDGDEIVCDKAGTFQTWHVPDLASGSTIRPLDIINPVAVGDGLSAPLGGFCSAHWFDYHQAGVVAQGYYQQGLRFIDVRDPSNLRQYGYVTGGASEVWDAYWVPQRDRRGRATGKKTEIVYTADFVRGVDVFEVDLPGRDLSEEDEGGLPLPVPLP